MAIVSITCPHQGCRLERAAFIARFYIKSSPNTYECFCECPSCHRAVIVVFMGPNNHHPMTFDGNIANIQGFLLREVIPSIPGPDTPTHTPPPIAKFYLQAYDSMQRGNWDAAGMMFRKTLESTVKDIHPEGVGNLKSRIESLPESIGVTPSMKAWANEVRDIGNESTHEGPETEADVKAIYNFTNMFLRYAYTMPSMMKERRGGGSSTP